MPALLSHPLQPNLCRTREALRDMALLQQFPDEEDALFSMVKYTYRTGKSHPPSRSLFLAHEMFST